MIKPKLLAIMAASLLALNVAVIGSTTRTAHADPQQTQQQVHQIATLVSQGDIHTIDLNGIHQQLLNEAQQSTNPANQQAYLQAAQQIYQLEIEFNPQLAPQSVSSSTNASPLAKYVTRHHRLPQTSQNETPLLASLVAGMGCLGGASLIYTRKRHVTTK